MKSSKDFVNYYHVRIEYYRKQRGGIGITQKDMELARKDVKKFLEGKVCRACVEEKD